MRKIVSGPYTVVILYGCHGCVKGAVFSKTLCLSYYLSLLVIFVLSFNSWSPLFILHWRLRTLWFVPWWLHHGLLQTFQHVRSFWFAIWFAPFSAWDFIPNLAPHFLRQAFHNGLIHGLLHGFVPWLTPWCAPCFFFTKLLTWRCTGLWTNRYTMICTYETILCSEYFTWTHGTSAMSRHKIRTTFSYPCSLYVLL